MIFQFSKKTTTTTTTKKNNKMIFSGMPCLLVTKKFFFWSFRRWKIRYFSSQKVDGKMIFTDYWAVLVLNFSEMKNTGVFSPKVDGKMLFADYWKVLVLNFSEMEIQYFFDPKSLWKDDIYWLLKNSCFELFSYGK